HHGGAPTVGAASDVGALWKFAIGEADRSLGHRRELTHGLISIIKPRLRVDAESRVLGGGMPSVRADDGKALQQRAREWTAAARVPCGGANPAVDPAVCLVPEASVPVERQAHLEADGIGLAVCGAHPFEHLAG